MKEYVKAFCTEFDYPAEACEALFGAAEKTEENPQALRLFRENEKDFWDGEFFKRDDDLIRLDEISSLIGVHKYTLHLLFYIVLSERLREMYKERNIPMDIYRDSMLDLRYKLFECHKVHGVWGSFVALWFKGFFGLKRFALGRLQFEIYPFGVDKYEKNGNVIKKGEPAINLHIPSSGEPITREARHASYARAAEFFRGQVASPAPFICHSWLLFPGNAEILPPSSNILSFASDFDILKVDIDEEGEDLWRVFGREDCSDRSSLPEETSLQRAYKKRLLSGGTIGQAYGAFFYTPDKIK